MMNSSRQEQAYSRIRSRVLDGIYGPGYRLVIANLATEFGISSIPVREALRRLEAEGLIRYTHNSGAVVTPVDHTACVETLAALAVLEGYAAASAAPNIDAEAVAKLRDMNAQMQAALEAVDPVRFAQLNRQFHFFIFGFCPNTYVVECLHSAWNRLDSMRRTGLSLVPGRGPSSVREHGTIMDAIEQRLPDLEMIVRQHKLNTMNAFNAWQRNLQGGSSGSDHVQAASKVRA